MIINLNNISKSYDDYKVLDNISFSVDEGEILGLIGLNGVGKSTLIKIILGILKPNDGLVEVFGSDVSKFKNDIYYKISVLFGQRSQLWWDLPVKDSFEIIKTMYKVSDTDFELMIDYLDEKLNIKQFFNRKARTLSLGQKTLMDFSLALLYKPKLCILDEPTIGLDILVKSKIRNLIIDYNNKFNTTFIITSHDLDDIEDTCNRVIFLNDKHIIFDGSLVELSSKYTDEDNYILNCDNPIDILSDFEFDNNKYVINKEEFTSLSNSLFKLMNEGLINSISKKSKSLEEIIGEIYG